MPVLVYEKNFVLNNNPIRIGYILAKIGAGIVYIVGLYIIAADHFIPVYFILLILIL